MFIQTAANRRVIDVRVFMLAKCIKGVQTEERNERNTGSAESSLLVTQPLFDKQPPRYRQPMLM